MADQRDEARGSETPGPIPPREAATLFARNLLFTIVIPGTVAVYVPLFAFPHSSAGMHAAVVPGALALCAGGAIYAWCVWDFATAGRGTPAPIDPPRYLVRRGLYRFTRNPMYLGVLLVIAGWAMLFRSSGLAVYALCVAAGFHLFVRLYEEPHLTVLFGKPYEQYCAEVGRWLPRPRRRGSR